MIETETNFEIPLMNGSPALQPILLLLLSICALMASPNILCNIFSFLGIIAGVMPFLCYKTSLSYFYGCTKLPRLVTLGFMVLLLYFLWNTPTSLRWLPYLGNLGYFSILFTCVWGTLVSLFLPSHYVESKEGNMVFSGIFKLKDNGYPSPANSKDSWNALYHSDDLEPGMKLFKRLLFSRRLIKHINGSLWNAWTPEEAGSPFKAIKAFGYDIESARKFAAPIMGRRPETIVVAPAESRKDREARLKRIKQQEEEEAFQRMAAEAAIAQDKIYPMSSPVATLEAPSIIHETFDSGLKSFVQAIHQEKENTE
jgi:hypothetical protein